jgi:hypothetical protein
MKLKTVSNSSVQGGSDRVRGVEMLALACVVAFALVFQLMHMWGAHLDFPSFRQCWSAFQAQQFYRESPPELHLAKINFLGHQNICVMNFPLYETLVMIGYHLVGGEKLWVARLINWFFYLIFCAYTYWLCREVSDRRFAWYTLAIMMSMPAGLFYGRAIIYETSILTFSMMYLCHGYRYLRNQKTGQLVLCAFGCVLGMLIKPPSMIPVVVALTGLGLFTGVPLRRQCYVWVVTVVGLVAGVLFEYYRAYVNQVANGQAAAAASGWAGLLSWFIGDISLRTDPARWARLIKDAVWYILNPVGLLVSVMSGVLFLTSAVAWRRYLLVGLLMGGAAIYLFTMFNMLSRGGHTWYYLPLVLPAAMWMAVLITGYDTREYGPVSGAALRLLLTGSMVALSYRNVRTIDLFVVEKPLVDAGAMIRQHTKSDELLLVSFLEGVTDTTDPRMLYYADRQGWNINKSDLSPQAIEKLKNNGLAQIVLLDQVGKPDVPQPVLDAYAAPRLVEPPNTEATAYRLWIYDVRQTSENKPQALQSGNALPMANPR